MPTSLSEIFAASAREHAERPAVRHEGGVVSYRELAAGVELLAGRLQESDLGGRRVGILLPNLPLFPLVFQAVLRAGSSAVLLNPLNSPREVAEYLSEAGVSAVFTAEPLRPLLPLGTTALLVDRLPGALLLADGAEPREVPLSGAPTLTGMRVGPDDEAAVLFTAANDGWARGAPLSHRNLVANLRSTVEAMRIVPDDCVVGALPYIHAFGLTVTLTTPLAVGASILPVERFRPPRLLEALAAQPATILAGVPAMFIGLLAAASRREAPAHALRLALSGGAALPLDTAEDWEERFGLPLRQGYGLTEAGPVCLFNRVDRPNRAGTLGYAFPDVDVSIRDLSGERLPAEEVGELCVRGENVFGGYLGEEGRRPADFHGDWLRTGDLATADAEGLVRFCGILKPMFTRNGFNVYPRELQRVLETDPRIAGAGVYALPDAVRENEIVLFIRPAAGVELDEEAVRELCRARMASYKQPARIEFE